ncbi:MAG: MogA/MoaB family molybdenum cofactor biosynthesis protein, partial [Rhizomicrobium sp.]
MPPLSDQDRIDRQSPFVPVHVAVLTVSDTRTKQDDVSGDTLVKRLEEAGHIVCARSILPDDMARIRAQLLTWIEDPRCDVVISTGGTGLTGRDVTVEAFRSVFDKEIDGFSVLFHQISYGKVGTSTIQSRACAGIANGTYLFA